MSPSKPLRKIEQNISNKEIDKALKERLDTEGLLRLKAVESSVYFFMGKSPTEAQFHSTYNKIYNFLVNGQTTELHQRGVSEQEPEI